MGNTKNITGKVEGPIWKAKIGVYSHYVEGTQVKNIQSKRWKIKEILN